MKSEGVNPGGVRERFGRGRRAVADAWRNPVVRRILVADALARLWVGVLGIAIFFAARDAGGSVFAAGAAVGIFSLGVGALAPIRGRLADRHGTRFVLAAAALHGVGLVGIALAAASDAGMLPALVGATVAGVSAPPIVGTLRAIAVQHTTPSDLNAFYMTDAIGEQAFLIVGPVLATLAVTQLASWTAAVAAAALALVAALVLLLSPPPSRSTKGETGRLGALTTSGMRTLAIVSFPIGCAFGVLDVALPVFALDHGEPAMVGWLVAAFAAGSVAGALVLIRPPENAAQVRLNYLRLLLLFLVGVSLFAVANSIPVALALAPIAGLAIAPLNVCLYRLLDEVAPANTAVEAFTWITTSEAAGGAVGSALAGALGDEVSARAALLATPVLISSALLVTVIRYRTLMAEDRAADTQTDPSDLSLGPWESQLSAEASADRD